MIDKKKWVLMSSGGGFTAEYTALLARATALGYTLPGASTQSAQNALVVALKAAGIWSLLDVFYVDMSNNTSLGNFALLNWVTPASYQRVLVNAPTYGVSGYTGNGSNAYIQHVYDPSTNGVNQSLDNVAYFAYCNTNTTTPEAKNIYSGGAAVSYRMAMSLINDGTNSYFRCNSTTDDPVSTVGAGISTTQGLWHLKRVASTGYTVYQNGTLKATITRTSTSQPSFLESLCVRNAGTPAFFSAKTISMSGLGSGAIDQAALSTAWATYKAAIGL